MAFPVVMFECENWTIKKAEYQRTDASELWCWRTFESPLDCREINLAHPKGNQPWIFIGRTGTEAEAPILWSPDGKSWLTGKDPDAEKDWGQEGKETTEEEMVWWHHWLDGHEFEYIPRVGGGQGGLVCCNSWGRRSQTRLSDWTELNPHHTDNRF